MLGAIKKDMLGAIKKEVEKKNTRSKSNVTSPKRKEPDMSILNP